MNTHGKENQVTYWDLMSEDEYLLVFLNYQDVILEGRDVIRVLGEDHPMAKIIATALETGDRRHLNDASKVFDVLSEEILDKVRHPWMGHPPPAGAYKKLIERISGGRGGVEWYLQIRGFETPIPAQSETEKSPEESENSVGAKIVYDRWSGWNPLRLLIREGADKEVVLDLLRQVTDLLEREWDELIDPEHYSDPPDAA